MTATFLPLMYIIATLSTTKGYSSTLLVSITLTPNVSYPFITRTPAAYPQAMYPSPQLTL